MMTKELHVNDGKLHGVKDEICVMICDGRRTLCIGTSHWSLLSRIIFVK
jgi:hypothetical protein